MFGTYTRWLVTLSTCGALVVGPTTESHAFFGLWRRWCERYYANHPSYVAQPACAQQVVNYVPQTCYRTQYCSVPVTTYRPVAGYDPNTNCPVTCMRPVTTYVTQSRMVAYQTYRLQYSNPCATTAAPVTQTYYPPATTMAPTTYAAPQVSYQPTATYAQPAVGGCSSCAAGGSPYGATQSYMPVTPSYSSTYPTTSAPATSLPQTSTPALTAPSYTQNYTPSSVAPANNYTPSYTPSTGAVPAAPYVGPTTPQPSLSPAPAATGASPAPATTPTPGPIQSTGPQRTFENGNGQTPAVPNTPAAAAPSTPMPPIVDPLRTPAAPMSGPGLLDPRARTTSMPVYRPGSYSEVNWPNLPASSGPQASLVPVTLPVETQTYIPAAAPAQPASTDGWRPSRR